ncbi:MAG: uroporphyrinogen-III synthase, partial [Bacteroidota bacterium]|nr:uroporphyrinogen-III synthase [Bacteroidota bacterium]
TGLKDSALVDRLNVYFTQKVMPVDKSVLGLIYSNSYDILIFTSPSAFDHFYELIRKDILSLNLKVACIGKTTAKAINSKGINPLIIANDSSIAGLAEAINNYFN